MSTDLTEQRARFERVNAAVDRASLHPLWLTRAVPLDELCKHCLQRHVRAREGRIGSVPLPIDESDGPGCGFVGAACRFADPGARAVRFGAFVDRGVVDAVSVCGAAFKVSPVKRKPDRFVVHAHVAPDRESPSLGGALLRYFVRLAARAGERSATYSVVTARRAGRSGMTGAICSRRVMAQNHERSQPAPLGCVGRSCAVQARRHALFLVLREESPSKDR